MRGRRPQRLLILHLGKMGYLWKTRKIHMLDMFCDLLGHAYCKFIEKICLRARKYYYASIWTYNFSIWHMETLNPLISMISGFSEVSLCPKTNIIHLWRRQETSQSFRKKRNQFTII